MPANLAREEVESELAELEPLQLQQLDSLWAVLVSSGGSVAQAIQSLGQSFHERARQKREIELAFAGPKATARLVAWLPLAGLSLAQLFGLAPFKAIFTNPIAFIALLFGGILLILSRLWTTSIIAKAAPSEIDSGLYFDSIRFGLLAGMPLYKAKELADNAMLEHQTASPDAEMNLKLERLAEINRTSGASIADLLQAESNSRREAQRFEESAVIEKLAIRLMIPLGVVTLPAFVLSTIVPIALSLLSTGQN